ncbi:GntR family transcriptional regulator [Corynebacterium sp. H128]|uniref:GntR family transcriptional regulator n=1 Tax=unclassified Corynebacterium TaxID=2624378 RepID=UPI003098A8D0
MMYINPEEATPVYQQLHDQIIVAIACGELRPGDKLDSVRGVAMNFGINPATVKKAYDLLKEEGVIFTTGRSGSVVAHPSGNTTLLERDVRGLVAKAKTAGVAPEELHQLIDAAIDELELPA